MPSQKQSILQFNSKNYQFVLLFAFEITILIDKLHVPPKMCQIEYIKLLFVKKHWRIITWYSAARYLYLRYFAVLFFATTDPPPPSLIFWKHRIRWMGVLLFLALAGGPLPCGVNLIRSNIKWASNCRKKSPFIFI